MRAYTQVFTTYPAMVKSSVTPVGDGTIVARITVLDRDVASSKTLGWHEIEWFLHYNAVEDAAQALEALAAELRQAARPYRQEVSANVARG